MKTNIRNSAQRTHEGAIASHINPEQQLRRSLMSCMLWEDEFYEDGVSIAERINNLCQIVESAKVSATMIEARNQMKLRHAPLWVACALSKINALKAADLAAICQRPDDMTEFLSLYLMGRKGKASKLSNQIKLGLAMAFKKFDAYQLGKYNRDDAIKLRNVLCLCHPKPDNDEQSKLWKKILNNTLESPDTWEVALSGGKDKKESFERLLKENKLGGLALLRNLRNMKESGVDETLVKAGLANMNTKWILPFRFIAAARYAPQWESNIEKALFKCLSEQNKLTGKTIVVVDVSGSMDDMLSSKSDMKRMDTACGLAMCVRELCNDVEIYSFSQQCVRIPDRHGFALRDAIVTSQGHGGTYLQQALDLIKSEYDRIIVITDEQSHDSVTDPRGRGYMINVASNQNGVGYGKWLHLDGFSEAILNYVAEYESSLE